MMRYFCTNMYYWVDVIFTLKFVLLMLTCGIPMIPIAIKTAILDLKFRSPLLVRVCAYSYLAILWVCFVLGLIFIPSVDAIKLTCLGVKL